MPRLFYIFIFLCFVGACELSVSDTHVEEQQSSSQHIEGQPLDNTVMIEWPRKLQFGDWKQTNRDFLGVVIGPNTVLTTASAVSLNAADKRPIDLRDNTPIRFRRPGVEDFEVPLQDIQIFRHPSFDAHYEDLIVPSSIQQYDQRAVYDVAVVQLPSSNSFFDANSLDLLEDVASIGDAWIDSTGSFFGDRFERGDSIVSRKGYLNASEQRIYKTVTVRADEETGQEAIPHSGSLNHPEDYGAPLYRLDPDSGQPLLMGLFIWGDWPARDHDGTGTTQNGLAIVPGYQAWYTRIDHVYRWIQAVRYCRDENWCGMKRLVYDNEAGSKVQEEDTRLGAELSPWNARVDRPTHDFPCGDLLFESAGDAWPNHLLCYNEADESLPGYYQHARNWGPEWIDLGATDTSKTDDGHHEICDACLVHTGCLPGEC